jgi:hypothetical protein
MTWKCVDCNTVENQDPAFGPARAEEHVVVDAVCHHCGRPICRKNRFLIADEAFAATPGTPPAMSFHCKECYRRHHDRAQAFDELTGAAAVRR